MVKSARWTITLLIVLGSLFITPSLWSQSVSPPTPTIETLILLEASFDTGVDGFVYVDDPFRGTNQPFYADGVRAASGGFSGGALRIDLGGRDYHTIINMSGGWQHTFTLPAPGEVTLSFHFKLTQAANYDSDGFSEVLATVDSIQLGPPGYDHVARLTDNGNGGDDETTGWQVFEANLGSLAAGEHTLTIGGYNNKKTHKDAFTEVMIDNVLLVGVFNNTPPEAHATSVVMHEDTAMAIVLTAHDPDDNPLTYRIVTHPEYGTLDGTAPDLIYRPATHFSGLDTFTYTVNDGFVDSPVTTVTIVVEAVNDAPTVGSDTVTTAEDTPVLIANVLANDLEVEGDPLTLIRFTQPTHGTVVVQGEGTFLYTPQPDFNGLDQFTYTVQDSQGATATGTVTITVTPVPDAPLARDDTIIMAEDTRRFIAVLANDSDVDGDALTIVYLSAPTQGTAVLRPSGAVRYTPWPHVHGVDQFTYTVQDATGNTATATVTVTIISINDAPTVAPDTATTAEDTPVLLANVLANDLDVEGDPLTLIRFTQPMHGTVVAQGEGAFLYTPQPDFTGLDQFTYTVQDSHGATANGTVTITVTPVNDAPTVTSAALITAEDNTSAGVTPSVTDVDLTFEGDTYTFTIASQPSHGTASIVSPEQIGRIHLAWDPVKHPRLAGYEIFYGQKSRIYPMSIDVGNQTTYTVTGLQEGQQYYFAVLAYDDAGNSSLFSQELLVRVPQVGQIIYTPQADFNGTDSFTYTATDSHGASIIGTATVIITPVNDTPIANDDTATTTEDTPINLLVLANDTDIDGDSLQVQTLAQPAHGTVVNNPNGTITYTPQTNSHGTDSFTYTIKDPDGATSTATVTLTITPVNDAPTANAGTVTTAEDTPATLSNILANFTDIDGDPMQGQVTIQPVHGTVVVHQDGSTTYTPSANFYGTDSFHYTVTDSHGLTATATISVTVTALNDPPIAIAQQMTTTEDTPITMTLDGSDPDGDALTVTTLTMPTYGTLSGTPPTLTYVPQAYFSGSDSFTFTVSDGLEESPPATVTLIVTTAALHNGGFENGDFTGWTTAGETHITTVAFGAAPTEGIFQAFLSTAGRLEDPLDPSGNAMPIADLETFLGLPPGRLSDISTDTAIEGSALKRTFTANAGDIVSFDWNFLTNEPTHLDEPAFPPSVTSNDFVFVTLTPVSHLADTFSAFGASSTIFTGETGFDTFTWTIPATGTYEIGIAVIDVGDEKTLSGLLVDNVLLTSGASLPRSP
jgi:VCBS repeat-containing protein